MSWLPWPTTARRGKGSESHQVEPAGGCAPKGFYARFNLQDQLGCRCAGSIHQPGRVVEPLLVIQELILVEELNAAVPVANHIQIDIDHLDTLLIDPRCGGCDVDVQGVLVIFAVVDERPEGRGRYELHKRVTESDRRLRAPLHDCPRRSSKPDTVLVLAESVHLVSPVEPIRVLEELNGDHVFRE